MALKEGSSKKLITITIDREVLKRLKVYMAQNEIRNQSMTIEALIALWLDKVEKKKD